MKEYQRIAEYLLGKSLPTRDEYRAPCPAHNGSDNNLCISEARNGRTLMHCHSHGCTFEQIADALPSFLWEEGANISARETVQKIEPKPLTLRAKDDSKTYDFAERMWVNSQHVDQTDHAYAVRKNFQPSAHCKVGTLPHKFGPLSEGDRVLVIKMVDEQGIFTGTQFINENGDRAFAGCQGMAILSNTPWTPDCVFHVVEGYATGTAVNGIFEGEQQIPVVAFSLGNLSKVEKLLRTRIKHERKFDPRILVHTEPEGIDLWDVLYDEEKRQRFTELQGRAA